jgi:hypothetical protein
MKTFARQKTLAEIEAQCAALGVPIDSQVTGRTGRVLVGSVGHGHALYELETGRFVGESDLGFEFDSDDDTYDDHEWFQQLLNFFLVDG